MGQELTGNSAARTIAEEGATSSAWEVEGVSVATG